jgi:hypothetical protein
MLGRPASAMSFGADFYMVICAALLLVTVSMWLPSFANVSGEKFGLLSATGGVSTFVQAAWTTTSTAVNALGVPTQTVSDVLRQALYFLLYRLIRT